MKVKLSRDKKTVLITFPSAKEASLRASAIDVALELNQEEIDFAKRLKKRQAAGIQ